MGDGRWQVLGPECSATFDAKLDAVEHAREKATSHPNGLVAIFNETGAVEAEHEYGHDLP